MQTSFDSRIISLKFECGNDYPEKPPKIKFVTKVNLPCVNQSNGQVDPSKIGILKDWKNQYTLEHILVAIKNEMVSNKKLPQPPEGANY